MADSLYYETGYADQGYVQRYIDSGPIGGLYVEDQYVEDGYIVTGDSIIFSMTVDATVIKNSVAISSAFTVNAVANGRIYVAGTDYTWDDLGDRNWDDWPTEVWDPTDFRISPTFTLSADADIFVVESASADLSSAFGLNVLPGIKSSNVADINSAFSISSTGSIKSNNSADLNTAFSLTATASQFVQASAAITSAFTTAVDGTRKRSATADINSAFSTTVDGTRKIVSGADLNTNFVLSSAGRRTRSGIVDIQTAFDLTAQGFPYDKADAHLDVAFALTAIPTRKRSGTLKPPITYAGDRPAKIVTPFGSTLQILSNTGKFGTGSMRIQNTGDYIRISGDSDLYSGDFTAEMWINASNLTSIPNGTIWDIRTNSSNGFLVYVSYGSIGLMEGINVKALTSAGFVNNSWNHIGIVRSGTNMKIFVNGTQKISSTVTATNYSSRNTFIGSTFAGTTPMRSYFDEVRLYNQALYSSNFTPSGIAFVNDSNTAALIHFEDYLLDDNGYIRSGDPGLLLKADISTFANVKVGVVANINSAWTVDTFANRKINFNSNISTAFGFNASANRKRLAISTMTSAFALTSIGTYKFTVPANRRLIIEPETRLAKTIKETRLYTLDSETRINTVAPENRLATVEQETRLLNNHF